MSLTYKSQESLKSLELQLQVFTSKSQASPQSQDHDQSPVSWLESSLMARVPIYIW